MTDQKPVAPDVAPARPRIVGGTSVRQHPVRAVTIGSALTIEWKDPAVPPGPGGVHVRDVEADGLGCLEVEIPPGVGWVRLVIAPPPAEGPSVLAWRLLLRVAPASGAGAARIVAMVGRGIARGKTIWREGLTEGRLQARLRAGEWQELRGVMACDAAAAGGTYDLMVNLPEASVVTFAAIDALRLPAEAAPALAGRMAEAGTVAVVEPFAAPVAADAVAALAGAPVIHSAAVAVAEGRVHGHVLADPLPPAVALRTEESGPLAVALGGVAELAEGLAVTGIGFGAGETGLLDVPDATAVVLAACGQPEVPLAQAAIPVRERRIVLSARSERGAEIHGVAYDRREAAAILEVELRDARGRVLAVARADLADVPIGEGARARGHGYRLDLDDHVALAIQDGLVVGVRGLRRGQVAVASLVVPPAEGVIDVIEEDALGGWVLPPEGSHEPMAVTAWVRGEFLGQAAVNRFRPEVTQLRRLDGFQGFALKPARPLGPQDLDALCLRVEPFGFLLPPRAEVVAQAKEAMRAAQELGEAEPERPHGRADRVDATGITGWAIDPAAPDRPVTVELYLDGLLCESVLSDAPRGDLARTFGTAGRHAFRIDFPPGLAPQQPMRLELRIRGTDVALANVPESFSRASPGLRHPAPPAPPAAAPARRALPAAPAAGATEDVAVIVINRDGAEHLERLFASFARENRHPAVRLYVIDHGSSDDSAAVAARWQDRLQVEFVPRGMNFSFSESNNFGARLARERVLLFLNNDIVLTECLVGPALAALTDPAVGAVGFRLASPVDDAGTGELRAGFVQHLGIAFGHRADRPLVAAYEVPAAPGEGGKAGKGGEGGEGRETGSRRVPAVTAAALAMRRADFEAIGGFDERYFYGYEDVDLCLNLRERLGKEILCLTGVTALHVRGATRSAESAELRRRFAANFDLLSARFGARVRKAIRREMLEGEAFHRAQPLRLAFAVSTTDMAAPEADFFTAYELGEFLVERHGWQVSYLPPASWYDLAEVDVVVAMRHDWSPRRIRASNPNLVCIGWARNWFDAWLALPWLDEFDMIWAASRKACDAFAAQSGIPVELLRIATNTRRFANARPDPALASDYCFTGSFFRARRELVSWLDPASLPYRFALIGHGWEEIAWLAPYRRGPLPYEDIAGAYAATRLVLDDCNHTVKTWGSVNARVFDALAAGALVITNGEQGSFEAFDGLLPVYRDARELHALIRQYLDDEAGRRALVDRLRTKVMAEHGYAQRADAVRGAIGRVFGGLRHAVRSLPGPAAGRTARVAELTAGLLRRRRLFVRRPDRAEGSRSVEALGDDVVIHVGCGEIPVDLAPRPDQVTCLLHLGPAETLSVAALRRYDVVVLATREVAGRFAGAVGGVDALFADEDTRAAAYEAGEGTEEITIHDMRALHAALDAALGRMVAAAAEREATKYDTAPVQLAAAVLPAPGPRVRVFYWPDYALTNPYQRMMYADHSVAVGVRAGPVEAALAAQAEGGAAPVVFHLHWTAPIIGNAASLAEAESRAQRFVAALDRLLAAGGRLVWTVHNILPHEAAHPETEARLCAEIAARAELIHVHGAQVPALARDRYALPGDRLVVARHGSYLGVYPGTADPAAARRGLGLPEAACLFLFLGQIRGYKGLSPLIEAFARLRARRPEAALLVAGRPVAVDAAELAASAGAVAGVTLALGEVPDEAIQQHFAAADFVVLPYGQVLTSGSVYLALSFGRPVIAPRLGLIPDVVDDGVEGLLYDPAEPDALERALARAAALGPAERGAMAAAALRRARACDWSEIRALVSRDIAALAAGRPREIDVGAIRRRCTVAAGSVMPSQRRVAAVVLHYGHADDTLRCLSALLAQRFRHLHVYVVSNDESADAFLALAAAFPACTHVQAPENLGYAGGNNIGLALAREAGFELVWIVNPDTVAPPDYLERMVALADLHPDVGVLGSRIMFGDRPDRVWFAGGFVRWENGLETEHAHIGRAVSEVPDAPVPCDYVTGASLFVRAAVIDRIGYIPEEYFLYFEETHWCLAAREAGVEIVTYPAVAMLHHKRSEEGGAPTPTYLYYFIRNAFRLARRFRPDTLAATEQRLRGLADRWLSRVASAAPHRIEASRAAVARGFADGREGVSGRVTLTSEAGG